MAMKIDCLAWASRSCAIFDPYPALRVGEGNTPCPAGSTLLNKEVNAMPISLAAAAQTYREAARDAVRRHSTFHLVQAALLVVAGIVAIVFPAFSSAAAVVVFGWLLIASGIIQAIGLISARHAPNFWLQIISAILGVLLGILLLRNIAQGMLLLSLLLIIFFMIEGMSKVVFALTIRPLPNWLWVFASGVLSVVLSLVLFAAMPVTALWLIGLMLGLDLIAIGAALGAMAWRLRGQAVPAA